MKIDGLIVITALALAWPSVSFAQDDVRDLRRMCWKGDTTTQKVEVEQSCSALIDGGHLQGNDLAHAYRVRGVTAFYDKRPIEAIANFEKSAELRPDMAETYVNLAMAWHELKDRDRTIAAVHHAESLNPGWDWSNRVLGYLRLEVGDPQGAIRNFRLAVRNGSTPVANNDLCFILATTNQNLDEAGRACDRAIGGEPFNPVFIDSRAMLKLRLGDYGGAEADYISAIALDPEQSISLYGRGLARIRLGRVDLGRADIARAVQQKPELAAEYASWGLTP